MKEFMIALTLFTGAIACVNFDQSTSTYTVDHSGCFNFPSIED